jgi:hypothetical protein
MYWGTDDTTAWNLAIDAAGAYAAAGKGGGVVSHPHGISLLAGGIFKKYSNIAVVGGGKGVSVMVAMADMNLLTLGSSINEDLVNYNVLVRGLSLDCNNLTQGLHLRNVTGFLVDDCDIGYVNGSGNKYLFLAGSVQNLNYFLDVMV